MIAQTRLAGASLVTLAMGRGASRRLPGLMPTRTLLRIVMFEIASIPYRANKLLQIKSFIKAILSNAVENWKY
ncbi:MAG: hypothetical protein ACREX0_06455 [Noviherbaspirillum sp.]